MPASTDHCQAEDCPYTFAHTYDWCGREPEQLVLEFQCSQCDTWFREGEGLVPHILTEHPFSPVAQQIDAALFDRLLKGEIT
jgi:hypothetical protein